MAAAAKASVSSSSCLSIHGFLMGEALLGVERVSFRETRVVCEDASDSRGATPEAVALLLRNSTEILHGSFEPLLRRRCVVLQQFKSRRLLLLRRRRRRRPCCRRRRWCDRRGEGNKARRRVRQ